MTQKSRAPVKVGVVVATPTLTPVANGVGRQQWTCDAVVPEAALHLKPGGLLVVELGHDSLPAVRPLLETPQWTNVHLTNDLAGIPRVLSAERT